MQNIFQLAVPIFTPLFLFTQFSGTLAGETSLSDDETVVIDPNKRLNETFFTYESFALYYLRHSNNFSKYFSVVLFLIGFPGNLISFLVWSNKKTYTGNSAAVYLAALSLNDTVVLAISLFKDLTLGWNVLVYRYRGSCEVMETISITVQYASPLYVLAFTVERWLAICQPFLVSRICSVRRAVYICFGIFFVTLVICSPMAFFYESGNYACDAKQQDVVFYFTTTMEIIYSLFSPLLVLTFNCLVIHEIVRIRNQQKKQFVPGQGTQTAQKFNSKKTDKMSIVSTTELPLNSLPKPVERDHSKQETNSENGGGARSPNFKSTTIMLLVVSFYVIIATLLGGVMFLVDIKFSLDNFLYWKMEEFETNSYAQTAVTLRKVKLVCDELALSHFAMGFVLYFATGRNFRQGVQRLLRQAFKYCRVKKSRRNKRSKFVASGRRKDSILYRRAQMSDKAASEVTRNSTTGSNRKSHSVFHENVNTHDDVR